jgi:hypothetical protein
MANQLAAEPVLAAVLARLRADATLGALVEDSPGGGTGVYEEIALTGAPLDYLVVGGASETPANTCGHGWGAAVVLVLRAVARTPAAARAIVSRAIALLDDPDVALVVDGYPDVTSELVSAGPTYPEGQRGETIHHAPATVRVTVHL